MPTLNHTETLGFAANVLKALEQAAESLRASGIDPETFTSRLRTVYDRTAKLNADQEAAKRQTMALTAEYAASMRELYVISSGALDVLMAAVRKDSDAAKNFRQLRSGIKRRRKPDGAADEGDSRSNPPD